MLAVWVLSLLGSALAGVSVRMPYLNPAGVTYTSYSAGYGPLAVKSLATPLAPLAAAPLAAAPLAAAPLAYSAPLTHAYATSAVVPITKVRAQPAVLQNVVDVAHPKLATRRYEIRRPAIQKQFYDIEERVVVRPAGSAVVELEQPISTNQRGPTQVSPAVHVAEPLVRYAPGQGIHFSSPAYLPSAAFAQFPQAPAVHEPSAEQEFQQQQQQQQQEQLQQQQEQLQQQQEQLQQQGFGPQPQPQPLPLPQPQPQPQPLPLPQPQPQPQPQFDSDDSVSIENPELARAQPQSLNLQQPLFRAQLERLPQPQTLSEQRQSSQQALDEFLQSLQFQEGTQQQFLQRSQQQRIPQQPQPQFFQRSQQLPQQSQPQSLQRSQIQNLPQQPQPQFLQRSQQQELQQQSQPQFLQRSQIQGLSQQPQPQFLQRTQLQELPRFQPLFLSSQPQGLGNLQFLERTQLQEIPQYARAEVQRQRTDQPDLSLARTQGPLLTPRPEISPRQGPTRPTALPPARLRTSQEVEARDSDVVPSARNLSPEQSQLNQQALIDLLTARGPVSEVRSAAGGQVRARVISATPAPHDAPLTDSRTNTRRVVVSRPIQTVQEVDVVEPFTKIERVAVHQPAVVKTAHVELAHVPAVTPVPLAAHYV